MGFDQCLRWIMDLDLFVMEGRQFLMKRDKIHAEKDHE